MFLFSSSGHQQCGFGVVLFVCLFVFNENRDFVFKKLGTSEKQESLQQLEGVITLGCCNTVCSV